MCSRTMDGDAFAAPYDPADVTDGNDGCVTKYCCNPTNGRLEWVQATVTKSTLNKGSDVTEEIGEFLLQGDKNPFDEPALLLHKSLGGRGDDVFNVFLEGRSFDRETYDNEVESTVFYAVSQADDDTPATVTLKFKFKDETITRPYRISYNIALPNGDIIENELLNV